MRYTVITRSPNGYGKTFMNAEDDSEALLKALLAETLGSSEVVCVIPGEVHPIVPKSRSNAMAATARDRAATASDAMENQNADRCARLDASDCSRMDSSCSRMASDCDSMVRSSCMNAGSSSSVAGVRSMSSGQARNGSGAFPHHSLAMAASFVSFAVSFASIAVSLAVLLKF